MGLVMNVQRFSLHDGPGIRTTAFLMGCNLRCRWCHNPESLKMARRMMFYANRCIGCGRCLPACCKGAHTFSDAGHSIDLSRCLNCERLDDCAKQCPAEAMVVCGTEYAPAALVECLMRDRAFFGSDGGVTFSGGEALLQIDFLCQCLELCRARGVSTCVDTAANVPTSSILRAAQFCDLFLVDLKAIDPSLHRRLCGIGNENTLSNIRALGRIGAPMWIRIPLVARENAVEAELQRMADFLKRIPSIQRVDLFPVINHAQDKYRALGLQAETFNDGIDVDAMVEGAMEIMHRRSDGTLKLNRLM